MKDRQIGLPSLHAMAMAFFAVRAAAAKGNVACADANNVVVADANCDGSHPAGTFFRFNPGSEDPPVGSVIDPDTIKVDAAASLTKHQGSESPPPVFNPGGLSKRQGSESPPPVFNPGGSRGLRGLPKRQGSGAAPPEFVAGGFGRRQCDDGTSGCTSGG